MFIFISTFYSQFFFFCFLFLNTRSTSVSIDLLVVLLLSSSPNWNAPHSRTQSWLVAEPRSAWSESPCGFLILLVSPSISVLPLCPLYMWWADLVLPLLGSLFFMPSLLSFFSNFLFLFPQPFFLTLRRDACPLWSCWLNDLKKSMGDLKIKWLKKKKAQ